MNTIKTFRDLLAFLTIIPVGKTDDFVITSAEAIFLFPIIGAFIGLLTGLYFHASNFVVNHLLEFFNSTFFSIPVNFLGKFLPAVMTLAFLLVITGLQHFDGLVDLGNALGVRKLKDRRAMAHAWVVTYKGGLLAIFIEFLTVLGIFLLNASFVFGAIIASEIAAKLAMVTISWLGKPTHTGLGSIFLETAKNKRNLIAYFLAILLVYPIFGLIGLWVVLIAVILGFLMERVAKFVFGGVSGDIIGATNEIVRSITLIFIASVLFL
jgi:adenosylcobinamide-GDP ribazoletransferase